MDRLRALEDELEKLEKKLSHMATEFAETKSGSAYGVEYFDIQVKVYQEMIVGVKKEIMAERVKLKK